MRFNRKYTICIRHHLNWVKTFRNYKLKHLKEKLLYDNIIKEFLRKGGIRCEVLNSEDIKLGDKIKVL